MDQRTKVHFYGLRPLGLFLLTLFFVYSCVEPPAGSPGDTGFPGDVAWLDEGEREPVDLSGSFMTLDGKEVRLNDLRHGKPLFLNVWATWCAPCRAEMPWMAALYEELSSEGLTMVAVSDEPADVVQEYLKENPYPFTVLLDSENLLPMRFEIQGIPTTLVIDREGRLVMRHTGAYQWDAPESVAKFRQLVEG